MSFNKMMLDWFLSDGFSLKENDGLVLSLVELRRLQFFAEHPEFADPVIWFLPEKCIR